jgi:hypothetical protein
MLKRKVQALESAITEPKPWVSLTDEEIDELHGSPMSLEHSAELKWVKTIEAKLKEKNDAA